MRQLLLVAGLLAWPAISAAQAPLPFPATEDSTMLPAAPLPAPAKLDRPIPFTASREPSLVPASYAPPAPIAPVSFLPNLPSPAAEPLPLSPSAPGPSPPPTGGASVSVEMIGPLTIAPGQSLPFEIVVRNGWTMPATQVRVELPLPKGARFLAGAPVPENKGDRVAWVIPTLDSGGEQRLKGDILPAPGAEISLHPSVAYIAAGLRARIVEPPFSITLTAPATTPRGTTAALRLQVANAGREPLRSIVANVKLPDGFRHPAGAEIEADVGDLAPGQSRVLTLEVVPTKAGNFAVETVAQAHEGPRAQGRVLVIVTETILALKIEGPPASAVGENVDLRLQTTNPGAAPAAGVRLSMPLPEELEFVSATGGGQFDSTSHAVGWSLPTLPGGGGAPLTVRARSRKAGEWNVQATAMADGGAAVRAGCTVRADEAAALALEISGPVIALEIGQETTLEMRLYNHGGGAAVNARVVAQIPDGLVAVRAGGPNSARTDGQRVIFEPLALAPRADAVYRIRVRAGRAGHWQFRASVAADHLLPIREEQSIEVVAAR